jgi:hypothetical protein
MGWTEGSKAVRAFQPPRDLQLRTELRQSQRASDTWECCAFVALWISALASIALWLATLG